MGLPSLGPRPENLKVKHAALTHYCKQSALLVLCPEVPRSSLAEMKFRSRSSLHASQTFAALMALCDSVHGEGLNFPEGSV